MMIYELRTYDFSPGNLAIYLKLFEAKGLPIIRRYADLIGYWIATTGAMPRTIHLWAYESLEHRVQQRHALYADAQWIHQFIPQAFPLIARQHSQLLAPVGIPVQAAVLAAALTDKKTTGNALFELRRYGIQFGQLAAARQALQATAVVLPEQLILMGYWQAISGNLTELTQLWMYPGTSPDAPVPAALIADAGAATGATSSITDAYLAEVMPYLRSLKTEFFSPADFSPMR